MKNQEGQSLVEMIVIIGMVVLLATGIVAGTTVSLSRSQTSQVRSQALSIAQAGIELARGQRDNGWEAFAALGDPQSTTVSTIDNKFTRSVTLELIPIPANPAMNEMKVTSRVVWGDTTNPLNKVELTTYLTEWR
jgi:type II secretory pathway pseudopilin PulG